MEFFNEAKEKLDRELKSGSFDKYGNAMKGAVHQALLDFCRQDREFAQAVVQGGSFADCMKAVGKCVTGNSISDIQAYGAAVKFYFPGAGIDVKMTINLCAEVEKQEESPEAGSDKGLILDLSAFL